MRQTCDRHNGLELERKRAQVVLDHVSGPLWRGRDALYRWRVADARHTVQAAKLERAYYSLRQRRVGFSIECSIRQAPRGEDYQAVVANHGGLLEIPILVTRLS